MSVAYIADRLITGDGGQYSPGLVVVHAGGLVKYAGRPENNPVWVSRNIHMEGTLVPGFVNAHTHLELSWMKGKVKEGRGLEHFVKELARLRSDTPDLPTRRKAMDLAIRAMQRDGTVAAGDVSNGLTSLPIKKGRHLQWHTFVEVFETAEAAAAEALRKGMSLYDAYAEVGKTSLVPHSPYSFSPSLLRLIGGRAVAAQATLSLHHLETAGELDFFMKGSGPVAESLQAIGQVLPAGIPTGKRPLEVLLPMLRGIRRLLLVNNIYASEEDVLISLKQDVPITWVLCPGSNLFLEGRLPDVPLLRKHKLHLALGTESLASCRTLSILRQMKIIQDHFADIPFSEMINWATWNGAQALGLNDQLGRIKAGTRPGLLQVKELDGERITRKTKVVRLH